MSKTLNFAGQLLSWFDRQDQDAPWQLRWQQTQDPYAVWLSEIMLQQTVMTVVKPRYQTWMEELPDLLSVAQAKDADLRRLARGLGYYRRFSLLHRAAQNLYQEALTRHHQDLELPMEISWPQGYQQWLQVPGVGPYTAAAVSSITQNEAVAAIDGNVERIAARCINLQQSTKEKSVADQIRDFAQSVLDPQRPGDFNQAMMRLGQSICRPLNPKCDSCPVQSFCLANQYGTQGLCPQAKERPSKIRVEMELDILWNPRTAKIALIERHVEAKFLPSSQGFLGRYRIDSKWQEQNAIPLDRKKYQRWQIGDFKHNITRHQIHVRAHVLSCEQPITKDARIHWVEPFDAEELLVSNLDRKALKIFSRLYSSSSFNLARPLNPNTEDFSFLSSKTKKAGIVSTSAISKISG